MFDGKSLAIGVIFIAVRSSTSTSQPIAETPLGAITGVERVSRDGRLYYGWFGVPYARPPIGKLRFQPPQAPKRWSGVLDATEVKPPCMQDPQPLVGNDILKFITEDCLYLNIFRPKGRTLKNMPVLMYINGGGSAHSNFLGNNVAIFFMDEDVVVVELTFRVNVFGFISLGDKVIPGNNGNKDLIAALRWIKNNVESFGGDPQNVVVFGDSSGGESAQYLMSSPLAAGLVSKAASHSGSYIPDPLKWQTGVVIENTLKLAETLGCKRSSSVRILSCLQTVDAQKILQAYLDMFRDPIQKYFSPVVEPKDAESPFFPEGINFRKTKIPWMDTFVNGEYVWLALNTNNNHTYVKKAYDNLTEYLENDVGCYRADAAGIKRGARILKDAYFTMEDPTTEEFAVALAKYHADRIFVNTAIYNIKNHHGPKWLCQLEYRTSLLPGPCRYDDVATHGSHITFYFNRTVDFPEYKSRNFYLASKRVIKYLVNFAYHGNPTPPGSSFIWKEHKTNEIMRITKNGDKMGSSKFYQRFDKLSSLWKSALGYDLDT